jgi:hypothetical protein
MIHLLETKLRTEQQYKRGTEKMIQLYTAEGDKKSRIEADGKRFESENKIQLLQQALKRYKSLYIMDDEEDGTSSDYPYYFNQTKRPTRHHRRR